MITITLTSRERDHLRALTQDNLPYATGEESDRLQSILEVLNPYYPWARSYTMDVLQWNELQCFIDDEDMGEFELALFCKISSALEAYADAEDAMA